jgi:hypothetical protein
MRMVPVGRFRVETGGAASSSDASSARRASPPSRQIPEQQPLLGRADQRGSSVVSGLCKRNWTNYALTMIKRRLEELNKHADDEERRMDLHREERSSKI